MPARRLSRRALVAAALVLGGLGLAWLFWPAHPIHRGETTPADHTAPATDVTRPGSPHSTVVPALVKTALASALAGLRQTSGGPPPGARDVIVELFHQLDAFPPDDRRTGITGFLETGRDAPAGLDYSVGPGGFLRSWPTLRVALIDYAGRLEREAMQSISELVLQHPGSPDEWSVALRNIARAAPTSEMPQLLVEKSHELLANDSWAASPSTGYLEAFDLLVHARLFNELGRLEALMSVPRPRSVRFAAFIAADRLALVDPGATLSALVRDPRLLASAPTVRAGIFARADVRDADQRASLETYLTTTEVSETERSVFAGLFPNHNTTFAHNLVTPLISRPQSEMIARDRAALSVLRTWRSDPRFTPWIEALSTCEGRLNSQLALLP